jgi:hypothetical protein
MTITPIETEGSSPTSSLSYLRVALASTEHCAQKPTITADGAEAVRSCPSFRNCDWKTARTQTLRHAEGLVALRWRGDPVAVNQTWPNRRGKLVMSEFARIP